MVKRQTAGRLKKRLDYVKVSVLLELNSFDDIERQRAKRAGSLANPVSAKPVVKKRRVMNDKTGEPPTSNSTETPSPAEALVAPTANKVKSPEAEPMEPKGPWNASEPRGDEPLPAVSGSHHGKIRPKKQIARIILPQPVSRHR